MHPRNTKEVVFDDPSSQQITEMVEYCHISGLSLLKHSVLDMSDVSLSIDIIAIFLFDNEEDATIFKLRFSGYEKV